MKLAGTIIAGSVGHKVELAGTSIAGSVGHKVELAGTSIAGSKCLPRIWVLKLLVGIVRGKGTVMYSKRFHSCRSREREPTI